jgi:activator of 2-hydroxyglutaryl-CoA dehydratase
MNLYLGIDLSSSKTGICILDENENIILSDLIKFDSKDSLEKRATILKDYFSSLSKQYKIERTFASSSFE